MVVEHPVVTKVEELLKLLKFRNYSILLMTLQQAHGVTTPITLDSNKGDWRVEEMTTLNKRMNCC